MHPQREDGPGNADALADSASCAMLRQLIDAPLP
jgi:hypothetical protein